MDFYGKCFRVGFSILLLLLGTWAFGCGGSTSPGPTRSAAMGFTYTPYDNTPAAITFALGVIANDGDLLVAHHDSGIPWDAALANDFKQYPQDVQDEVTAIVPDDNIWNAYVALSGRFVNYFVSRGYDALFDKLPNSDPNKPLVRLWRDTGLYAGDGTPRPALSSWRSILSRPLR